MEQHVKRDSLFIGTHLRNKHSETRDINNGITCKERQAIYRYIHIKYFVNDCMKL